MGLSRTDGDTTTERVGHLSEEATAMGIDGFRGLLIITDHGDDHGGLN